MCYVCWWQELNKVQKEKDRAEQAERQAIIEQERRDREIALRLASEDQNQVEDVTLPPLMRYKLMAFILQIDV